MEFFKQHGRVPLGMSGTGGANRHGRPAPGPGGGAIGGRRRFRRRARNQRAGRSRHDQQRRGRNRGRAGLCQHREPRGRGAVHVSRAQGGLGFELQHVDQWQGDGRRGRGEKAGPRNLRQLQTASAAIPACSSKWTTNGSRCASSRSPRAPSSACASRTTRSSISITIGPTTSIPGHGDANRRQSANHRQVRVLVGREERSAHHRDGQPFASGRVRDRQACRCPVLAGQPGNQRRPT